MSALTVSIDPRLTASKMSRLPADTGTEAARARHTQRAVHPFLIMVFSSSAGKRRLRGSRPVSVSSGFGGCRGAADHNTDRPSLGQDLGSLPAEAHALRLDCHHAVLPLDLGLTRNAEDGQPSGPVAQRATAG